MFSALQGNAGVIVVTEAASGVPLQWYSTYLPLYMLALGVSEIQVGLLASALMSMQFVSTLLGGYAADRFGRKRVLVVCDIVCWGVPMFLYAIAQNPWYFLAGRLINGFVYVVLPSFECLFVEDVAAERRIAVFGSLNFLTAAASLLAPVAGFLVASLGIVAAGRVIMLSNMVALVGAAAYRQIALQETTMGRERMATVAGVGPQDLIAEYVATLRAAMGTRPVRVFLFLRTLNAFALVVWATYGVIYLAGARGLQLPESTIALLPFLSSLVTMAMLLLAASRMAARWTFSNLILGQALCLVAGLLFVLAPAGFLGLAAAWAATNAMGLALFRPASASYWANIVGDRERAQIFSASSALMALCTIPAGPVAGLLYVVDARLPFVLAMALQAMVLVLIVGLRRAAGDDAAQDQER